MVDAAWQHAGLFGDARSGLPTARVLGVRGRVREVLAGEVPGELQIEVILAVLGGDVERLDVELDSVDIRVRADLAGDLVREACRELWAQLVDALHVAIGVDAAVDDRRDDQRTRVRRVEGLVVRIGTRRTAAPRRVERVQVVRAALRTVVVRAVHLQIAAASDTDADCCAVASAPVEANPRPPARASEWPRTIWFLSLNWYRPPEGAESMIRIGARRAPAAVGS